MFGGSTQSTPAPVAPDPPANPPMYGAQAVKKKGGGGIPQQFNASMLGTIPGPGGTGQKSLLGQ